MWVQLALPSNPNEVRSIQTLISSKASGCEVDGSHNGIALFANAWNTNSGQLFLSWGNSHSGCEELATREQVLTPGRWHFVAATRDTAGHAALYVDGELLASTDETQGFSDATKGARMRVVGGTAPIAIDAWRSHPLRFGAHVVAEHGSPTDNLHYLRGYLANVAVHTVALSESQQRRLICGVYESIWGIGGIGGMPAPLLLLRPPKGHTTVDTGAFDPLSRPAGGFVLVSPGESGVDHEKHPPPFITSAKKPKALGLSLHELERRKQEEIHRKLEEERQKELAAEAAQAAEAAAAAAAGGGGDGGGGGGDGGGGGGGDGGGGGWSAGVVPTPRFKLAREGGGGGDMLSSGPVKEGWPIPWLPARPRKPFDAAAVNASDALAYKRREAVRGVMRRAWSSYRKYAWGADELKPVSNRSHEWLHLGATLVDCLDNLWIMGMRQEFQEAREWVATSLHFRSPSVSMFETVIRILGGLLSAFELSKDKIFLTKAKELADKMMYAFDQNPQTGLPCTTISLIGTTCNYASWTGHSAILAEFGTIQLEFKYLAYHTGEKKYWDVVERIMTLMRRAEKPNGLYPVFMSPSTGTWTSQKVTLGALGDSFYEYLIKQFLFTKKKEGYLREMFDSAALAIAGKLVQRSTPSKFVYIADWNGGSLQHKMDHLACFAGAMYAVAAQDGGRFDAEYMTLADEIGETCYKMYTNTRSGLSPEFVNFVAGSDLVTPSTAPYNIGRPEAVETWFYMWYFTRDPKWREMGWTVFEAFERYAATPSGWTALPNVNDVNRKRDDKMESFVLAETVKYFYLLFDPDYPIKLEEFVFNTEAHPLRPIDPM